MLMAERIPPAVSEAWEAYDRERLKHRAMIEANAPAAERVAQALLADQLHDQFLAVYRRWCGRSAGLVVVGAREVVRH